MSLYRKIKDRGLVYCIELVFNRIVPARLFRFSQGIVFELDVSELVELQRQLDSSEYVTACVEDPDAKRQLRQVTWNSVPEETSSSHFGYSICRQDSPHEIIGGVWGGIDRFNEADLGFQINLSPGHAWIYCAYVNKEARGEGIYKRVLSYAAADLQARGYQRLWVMIQPWNKISLHVHSKHAKGMIGRVSALRVLRLATVFCTGDIRKNKMSTTRMLDNPVVLTLPAPLHSGGS